MATIFEKKSKILKNFQKNIFLVIRHPVKNKKNNARRTRVTISSQEDRGAQLQAILNVFICIWRSIIEMTSSD